MAHDAFCFDDYDLEGFTQALTDFGSGQFGYVVTPNTDHLIRLKDDAQLRAVYADASFVLLDSRFVALIVRLLRGVNLPVCTGSDLTAKLLSNIARPLDSIVLVGGTEKQAQTLRERFGLQRLMHYNPPMGFINDPAAVDECLEFIESHSPFRFCLLAVGSPQQEVLAQRLQMRGKAKGLALCVGASVDFLTGREQRAPLWMQRYGLEWAYRLAQNPKRLAYRYLVRGPRIFPMLRSADITLRRASLAAASAQPQAIDSSPPQQQAMSQQLAA